MSGLNRSIGGSFNAVPDLIWQEIICCVLDLVPLRGKKRPRPQNRILEPLRVGSITSRCRPDTSRSGNPACSQRFFSKFPMRTSGSPARPFYMGVPSESGFSYLIWNLLLLNRRAHTCSVFTTRIIDVICVVFSMSVVKKCQGPRSRNSPFISATTCLVFRRQLIQDKVALHLNGVNSQAVDISCYVEAENLVIKSTCCN